MITTQKEVEQRCVTCARYGKTSRCPALYSKNDDVQLSIKLFGACEKWEEKGRILAHPRLVRTA
jgi:hypothetical protein